MTLEQEEAIRLEKRNRALAKRKKRLEFCSERVSAYMLEAISHIDSELGEEYAKKHPELLAGFIQAAVRLEIYRDEWEDKNNQEVRWS